jgi:hypothetical protein
MDWQVLAQKSKI